MERASGSPRTVTGLFADSADDWRTSVAYRDREAELREELRQIRAARGSILPLLVVVPLCAIGWYILEGVWALLAAFAGGLLVFTSLASLGGSGELSRRRREVLDRSRQNGLGPSVAQVRDALQQLRPGRHIVHTFSDGRVVRFDESGATVANLATDELAEIPVAFADVRMSARGQPELELRADDASVLTFPFGEDEDVARAVCELLKEGAKQRTGQTA
jgi:hypothetical protein